jgi:hypothetical protein
MKSNRNVVIEISHSSAVKAVCLIIFLDGPGTWQRTSGHAKAIPIVAASDLPAGTAGTGRVHPRQAAGRAGTGTAGMGRRFFFFQNHICARRGYTGTTSMGTGVLGHTGRQVGNETGRRVKRYNSLLNRYNDL